jgi:hypothetical protein
VNTFLDSQHRAELPDPRDAHAPHGARCGVTLYDEALWHIVEKHVISRGECWDEWLPKQLVRQLHGLAKGQGDADRPAARQPAPSMGAHGHAAQPAAVERAGVLAQLAKQLLEAARECLERPLVLLATRASEKPGPRPVQCWQLVLRCGALMVIEARGERVVVKTCFFPKQVCRVPKSRRRWVHLLSVLVQRHARIERGELRPPRATDVRRGLRRTWHNIRFVTLESWGFRTDMEGAPWRGRPPAWPGEVQVTAPTRRRLSPRRLMEEEAYDNP